MSYFNINLLGGKFSNHHVILVNIAYIKCHPHSVVTPQVHVIALR